MNLETRTGPPGPPGREFRALRVAVAVCATAMPTVIVVIDASLSVSRTTKIVGIAGRCLEMRVAMRIRIWFVC